MATIESKTAALPYAAIPLQGTMEQVVASLPVMWPEVSAWLSERGIAVAGAPFIRYRRLRMPDLMEVEVGIPTAILGQGEGRIECGELPAGDYVETLHTGPYDGLMQATAELLNWAQEHQIDWDMHEEDGSQVWTARLESYLTDPGSQPDSTRWQTLISIKTAGDRS